MFFVRKTLLRKQSKQIPTSGESNLNTYFKLITMVGSRCGSHHGNTVAHIFQRARNGFVVFYNVKDSLFFITSFCIIARRHGVKVLALCLMYNHVHILLDTDDKESIRLFIKELMSYFCKSYNRRYGLSGVLFDSYGVSLKKGDKAIRTALAYVNNNPVEDHICGKAEEWRWNFLAYSDSEHPYSEKVNLGIASRRLRRAVAKVKYLHATERPLTYEVLDNLFDSLAIKEKQQLVDLIINEYAIVDFRLAISFYGDYDKMLIAFASNTGSEYEISEPFDPHSGQAYRKMADFLARDNRFKSIGEVINLPLGKLVEYLDELVSQCGVRQCHAMKFLHIIQNRLGT